MEANCFPETICRGACLSVKIMMEMETFEIQLTNQTYIVEPQENGTFRLLDGEEKIGVIYPEVSELGTEWKTMDDLEDSLVQDAGKLISEHQS